MTVTWAQAFACLWLVFWLGVGAMNWRWGMAIKRGTRGFKASLKNELEEIREQQEGFWRQLEDEIERNPQLGIIYLGCGLKRLGKGASA